MVKKHFDVFLEENKDKKLSLSSYKNKDGVIKLRALRDFEMSIRNVKVGDIVHYKSWDCDYRGVSPEKRLEIGVFVFCHGQGDWDYYYIDEDVEAF